MTEPVCVTCRTRKVKCDRAKPRCRACVRLNIECIVQAAQRLSWLEPWMDPTRPKDSEVEAHSSMSHATENVSQRRPLFTEPSRRADCVALVSALSDARVETILEQLDDGGRTLTSDETLSRGPFAVFHCGASTTLSTAPIAERVLEQLQEDYNVPDDCDLSLLNSLDDMVNDLSMTPWLRPIFEISDTYEADRVHEGADTLPTQGDETMSVVFDLPDVTYTPGVHPSSPTPTMMPINLVPDVQDFPLSMFQRLLEHYSSSMIKVLSFSQLQASSPWKLVFLPYVLQTFAEITLFGNSSSHARMALLFFVLSTSAHNMENLGLDLVNLDRSRLGGVLQQRAKRHVQKCLQEMRPQDSKGKYKEVLMALLSAIIMSVTSGQINDAQVYLLDAERLIFLHGFDKRHNSQKIQTLHSIYVYFRIFGETTSRNSHPPSNTSPASTESDGSASYRFPSAWTKSFATGNPQQAESDNASFETEIVGPVGVGFNPSVLEQIYQIPEFMLQMISHTTQLANDGTVRTRHTEAYCHRVKQLEDRICNYKNPTHHMSAAAPCEDRPLFTTVNYLFSHAVHSAILVYFYQRVRRLNLLVLQQYVAKIVNNLLEIERLKTKHFDTSADLSWPAFIAGSAAQGFEHRDQISSWLLRSAQRTGFQVFLKARDVLLRYWKECDENQSGTSWIDLLERQGCCLLLT